IQKLYITRTLLRFRREHAALFIKGEYIPVSAKDNDRLVIAYLRHYGDDWLLVVLPLGLISGAGSSLQIELPANTPSRWKDLFTGEILNGPIMDTHQLYAKWPVAVLQAI